MPPLKSKSPAHLDTDFAPELAKRIELWSTDRLIPFARNPRTHSDAQVAQIAASLVEFGFNNPILVDSKAGIVAGRGRLLADRKLGLPEVRVVVLADMVVTAPPMTRAGAKRGSVARQGGPVENLTIQASGTIWQPASKLRRIMRIFARELN